MSTQGLLLLDQTAPHTFVAPVKKINEGQDVSNFLVSKAYNDIITFLLQLNRTLFPRTSDPIPVHSESHSTILGLRDLLKDLNVTIDEAPPDPGPRRFGNISFRTWNELLRERAPGLMQKNLPASLFSHPGASDPTATQEMTSYLLGSFGSAQRLDYGTGHELNFLAFLGCIWKLGGFSSSTSLSDDGVIERSIVLEVVNPYLHLVRRLIKTYTLEPAGSHGVWGLDDHSFLPYIFGSAQYSPPIPPAGNIPLEGSHPGAPNPGDVVKPNIVSRERSQNFYFGAIGFIYDMKKGPFWEHSPMLFDISGVKAGWAKINKGMLKMYNAEVLSKFPVVQHFYFGSLFSWERDPSAEEQPASVHARAQPAAEHERHPQLQFSTRAPPVMAGTAAPWASKESVGMDTPAGTAAPWAKSSNTAAPHVLHNEREAPSVASRRPPAFAKGSVSNSMPQTTERNMPVPTKAPWVKPG